MRNEPVIDFTTLFEKQRKQASLDIKEAFLETLQLFLADPNHPSLRNHALSGAFTGYRSIDITGDWRALFKESGTEEQKAFIFHMIGTHKELYG